MTKTLHTPVLRVRHHEGVELVQRSLGDIRADLELGVTAERKRGDEENEVPDCVRRLRFRILLQPAKKVCKNFANSFPILSVQTFPHILEKELGEEDVTLARSEVIEQRLRVGRRVLEEAEDGDEHLHDLERRELRRSLHVLDAERDAALVCND